MRHPVVSFGAILRAALAVAAVGGGIGCGLSVSPLSANVIDGLGHATGFTAADCGLGEAMLQAYTEEIERTPSELLSVTLPRFARRAKRLCPQSRPVIKISQPADATAIATIIGAPAPGIAGSIPLETWLFADVDNGYVVGLTLDLSKLP